MEKFSVGQPVKRTEDPRLLKGHGQFLDDISLTDQAHGFVVRSPYAYARIRSINVEAAKAAPGVIAVLTAADLSADGIGPVRCVFGGLRRGDEDMFYTSRAALVADCVRHVGDPVALIVAESVIQARDAAELIDVDYDALRCVTSAVDAMGDGAPLVWDDCPGNVCFRHESGDDAATAAGFDKAVHVTRRRYPISRVSANTIEPRGCVGSYDARSARYTLYAGLQAPHGVRRDLAENIFGQPEHKFRVVARDVGGSFGMKGGTYLEYVLVLWASKRIGRPVKWICDRSEAFTSDNHARDNVSEAALALDENGRFLALRVSTIVNVGAYLASNAPVPAISNLGSLAGVYTTPAIHVDVTAVFTNTNSTAPYRGAGRPEASYLIERLIDTTAGELDIDPVELRRRNTIPSTAMPYKTALTFTYDSGMFEKNMDQALELADRGNFEGRRSVARARGKLRGLGISNTIEQAGRGLESAEVRFDPGGSVTVLVGTISHGQGHDTVFRQLVCDRLGLAPEAVRIVEGDTDAVAFGVGTMGSRSMATGGAAITLATNKIIEKGRQIAAHRLEAAAVDVVFSEGRFAVSGTDRSISLGEIVGQAFLGLDLPPGVEGGFAETASFVPEGPNFPNGCHVCELEIDEDTGDLKIVHYAVVDDVGIVVNPLLLEGQIHGGIAQGAGQAISEAIVYDEDGQLLTGSFLDYEMPRADTLCSFVMATNPVPTATNPLGVKGAGEAGTVGALAAVTNAVADALAPLGIGHVDMPATPERIWRAIRDARVQPTAER
jgi:carbon-monoxide dehydrogenase large subunit